MAEEQDLILGNEEAAGEEPFLEETPLVDVIAACTNALTVAESYNCMSKADERRKTRVMRKSFRLLDYAVSELYALHFGEETEEED
jgi:hypothetical protein